MLTYKILIDQLARGFCDVAAFIQLRREKGNIQNAKFENIFKTRLTRTIHSTA